MNKGLINNNFGQVRISGEVIAMYAGLQAVECFGIVGMAAINMRDGLVRLLKRDSLSKGISVNIIDNKNFPFFIYYTPYNNKIYRDIILCFYYF